VPQDVHYLRTDFIVVVVGKTVQQFKACGYRPATRRTYFSGWEFVDKLREELGDTPAGLHVAERCTQTVGVIAGIDGNHFDCEQGRKVAAALPDHRLASRDHASDKIVGDWYVAAGGGPNHSA
jgi:hypothetical protein